LRPRPRHARECRGQPLPPARSARVGVGVGLDKIVGPILGERLHQKRRLGAILGSLEAVRPVLTTVSDDQFMDRVPFGSRNLHEHDAPVGHGGSERSGYQEIKVM